MLVVGRLLLFLIIVWSSSLFLNIKGDFTNTKERTKRHIFPLLGYLHGYKIGQNFALQFPPFVLSPVVIVPSVNQQQSVNIQKGATDESFQENGSTFQTIMTAKLILNTSLDIDTDLKSSLEKNTLEDEKAFVLNNTLRQINEVTTNTTVNEETTSSTEENTDRGELVSTTENFETTETEELTTLKHNTTTTINGVYPTAMYNNEIINSLQLTTPPSEIIFGLPSLEDKWQNFTSNANEINNKINETENIGNDPQESAPTHIRLYEVTTEKYYPYPRPNTRFYNPFPTWYNAKVDQFSITTNSYRGEKKELPLPPSHDDRWHRFSSLSKVVSPASGFKPLAGLYYDGFLHKSLTKKTGFIPFDKHFYY